MKFTHILLAVSFVVSLSSCSLGGLFGPAKGKEGSTIAKNTEIIGGKKYIVRRVVMVENPLQTITETIPAE
jgi:hypothetical protein